MKTEQSNGEAKEILGSLLERAQEIDFERAKQENNENYRFSKVTKQDRAAIVIFYLLNNAKKYGHPIAKIGDEIHIFNGEIYEKIDSSFLENYLVKYAIASGMEFFEAKYHKIQTELFVQLYKESYTEFDENNNEQVLLPLTNIVLSISAKKREQLNFSKNFKLTYQLGFNYDPNAKRELFQKFLDDILPPILQLILAEVIASIFIKNSVLKLEKIAILFGEGANGKSVFFEIIIALLGEQNVSNFSLENLTDQKGQYRGMAANKLLNYASEISGKIDPNRLKQLASNEPIDACFVYGKPFIIKDYAKIICNCNTLPQTENTNAFFRRFLIIPFDKTIAEKDQDKELANKIIQNELSGVLNWVLEGLQRLLKQKKFTESNEIDRALLSYKRSSDSVLLYLEENKIKRSSTWLAIKEIYNDYRQFCYDWSYPSINKTEFIKKLKSSGFDVKRMSNGIVVYIEKETI